MLIALICVCAAVVTAQGGGVVRGKVVDETGAAIPLARIMFIDTATGATRELKADGSDGFAVEDVRPGEYLLHVTAAGFQAVDHPVTVGNDALKPLTVMMQVGLEEDVTVAGNRRESPLQAGQNADAIAFNRDFLGQLPVDGQDVVPLISSLLAPSSRGVDGASIVVDGVEGDVLDLSASAIRRITVNRNPYSAEFRRPGKARVEVATEHGSLRKVHGSVAFIGRYAPLDARNPFARTKPDEEKQLVEGSFGSPLPEHHAALFLTGSRLNLDESAVVHARTLASIEPLIENVRAPQRHTAWYGRLDVHPNDRHTLTGRYDFSGNTALNQGVGGLHLAEQAFSTDDDRHRLLLLSHSVVAPFINEVRAGAELQHKRSGQPADRPAVVVHGAFTGGPSQTFHVNDQTVVHVQDVATYFRGAHTVQLGGQGRFKRVHAIEGSNFGGTFEFAGLDGFARGTPILFRITRGTPGADLSPHEAFAFVQDDVRVGSVLSFMAGLRGDWQARPGVGASLAPRAAAAWAPGAHKTVLRVGAGAFYDHAPDAALVRASLFDGQRLRELVTIAPGFPDLLASQDIVVAAPNVVRIAPDIRAPELLQASAAAERELWARTRLAVEYQAIRGRHLLRSRNLYAPFIPFGPRPDPAFLNVLQVESTASMRSDALSISLNGQVTSRFKGAAHYTWSKTTDDSSGVFVPPADSGDLAAERGRADDDRRHSLNAVGTWDVGRGFRLGAVAALASGVPFDITTGFDNNGDGLVEDRPVGVTRNTGQGPGLAQVDVRVTKVFPLRPSGKRPDKGANLQVSVDAFNVFNRVNFRNFIGVQTSPFFAHANGARPARMVQLSAKYKF